MKKIIPFVGGPRSLGAILGSFQKTVDELTTLITKNELIVDDNCSMIDTLIADNTAINAENRQAYKVRANIKQLIEE